MGCLLGSLACVGGGANSDAGRGEGKDSSPNVGENLGRRQALMVELFSWWTAPGEAEALQALMDAHRARFPSARLFNAAAASGNRAREIFQERMEHNDPPELYQITAHDLRSYVIKHPNDFETLDDVFDKLDLRRVVFPEVLENIKVNGKIYSMPVNLHRENSLIYNKHIFDAQHLSPPRTIQEFLSVCEQLKRAGVVPVATAYQDWVLRIMFSSLTIGVMGGTQFHDVLSGTAPPDVSKLEQSVELLETVLDRYANPDAAEEGFGWLSAVQALYNGDAAMFLHGDWAKGHLMQLGWRPGIDFGVIASPGASDVFLYGIDVFALPSHARNEAAAREFLKTIASPAAQAAFDYIKGASPIRADIPTDRFDEVGKSTLDDLKTAKIRMVVPSRRKWHDAFGPYSRTRNKQELLRTLLAALREPE